MDELREKAKQSIRLKKDAEAEITDPPSASKDIGNGYSSRTSEKKEDTLVEAKQEVVSDKIDHINSEKDRSRDNSVRRSRERSSRHKSSKHRRHRDHKKKSKHRSRSRKSGSRHRSGSRHKRRRKRSYSRSDSASEERRRRRHKKHRRHSSSSSGSRGRHHRKKYSRRRRHTSSSSNSSDSSRSRRRGDKNNHPYFSKLSKIRREKLAKQRENKFWDGFQWVSKESIILANKDPTKHLKKDLESGNVDFKKDEKLVTGKDLRRVVATNLPLDYGLDQEDLANYLMVKCKEKGDDIQFRSIFLNYEHNSGIIEVMEKEQTDLLIKIDGDVLFGHTLRFTKVADENGFIHGGDSENLMQDSAQLTAQAAAIVNARIKGLQGKGGPTNLNMIGESNLISTSKPSRFIKIYNAFDRYETMSASMFEEMYEDMEEMMLQFGQFNMLKIIKNGEEKLGAEVGSVFVEFATEEEAKAAKETLKGKIYDGREVKSIFVPEEVMKNEVKLSQK